MPELAQLAPLKLYIQTQQACAKTLKIAGTDIEMIEK